MDRFHTNTYTTLYNHLKAGLHPPIETHDEDVELQQNVKALVLDSNLHVFDDAATIWKKLKDNKHKFSYFDKIKFD